MRVSDDRARPVRHRVLIFLFAVLPGFVGGIGLARAQSAMPGPDTAEVALSDAPTVAATPAALPDAPEPADGARSASAPAPVLAPAAFPMPSSLQTEFPFLEGDPDSSSLEINPGSAQRVPLSQCPYDKTDARECRVNWHQLIITSAVFNAFLNAGNLYTGYWYRWETTHGKWFQRWFDSDLGWNWQHWTDGNPRMDQYVGHPMMGAITNYMWIQNDPKGATLEIGEPGYWKSRMRATAFTTLYHFEWKFGPFGEAGVGHIGDHPTHEVNGSPRNDTGDVELVTTPVGGLLWTMAEDVLDKHVVKRLEATPRRPVTLLLISFLTPGRATGNLFRFRPPWYRDGRTVKAATFFSEPPGPGEAAVAEPSNNGPRAETSPSSGVQPVRDPEVLPLWPHYGGVHEFGAWWGVSLMTGHIWGYAKDIKYMPVDVTYSYLLHPGTKWNFRYAPELTALAMLDEPQPGIQNRFNHRKRTYGSGISPVGFRASLYPESRVQPFLSTDGGFIYFVDRVLSPQGSQFTYTVDFGGGLQIFRKQRQAVTIGYRYQHLSNANISLHNPGTDTNVFYLAVSRFRSKGYR